MKRVKMEEKKMKDPKTRKKKPCTLTVNQLLSF